MEYDHKYFDMPQAILMHPNSFHELFSEMEKLYRMIGKPDCPAKFYGIPIYRTNDVETFKIL